MVRPGLTLLLLLLLGAACARSEKTEPAESTAASKEKPSGNSTIAFTLREKDLIPEGIAADPATGRLFVGSIEKRKIVALSPEGKESTFVPSGAAGLGPVIGLRVDSAQGRLWAVSEPDGRPKSDPGTFHGLYAFTLSDGSLAAKVELPRKLGRGHSLNDLCLDDAGTVYVTDSASGAIYRAAAGEKKLSDLPLAPGASAQLRNANGIVCTPNGSRLYVAAAEGVVAVDPKAGTAILLATPPDVPGGLGGCDGLYLEAPDRLIGIQNGYPGKERVLRATLDATGLAATRIEVLLAGDPSFEIPTTGAILDGAFFLIANSQVASYDPAGNLDRRKLARPVILRLPL
jgi:sugar lactone lactonase YvrE